MGLTPDQLGAGFVGLIIVLGALGQYLRSLKSTPVAKAMDPVLTSVGLELGNREQTERLIQEVRGMRLALEVLADRRTEEVEEMHKAVLERLDIAERRKEQEEQRPRRPPPRRR